jgi:1-acyl-sn-glycerol-3-phosphate acyltransferase
MEPQQSTKPKLGWSLEERDRNYIQMLMPLLGWFYHNYFRVETSGWHHIPPNEQVLIVGSHNGGFASPDMFMMIYDWFERFGVDRPTHGLMHPKVWQANPDLANLVMKMGAIAAHPKMAAAAWC